MFRHTLANENDTVHVLEKEMVYEFMKNKLKKKNSYVGKRHGTYGKWKLKKRYHKPFSDRSFS